MISLQIVEEHEQNLTRLKGFSLLLSSNEVRDAMNKDTLTGLEYILMDIIDGFDAAQRAMSQSLRKG